MKYTTIWETTQQNQALLLKNIFEQNNIKYRFLDENSNTNFSLGVRIQVAQGQEAKAGAILRENGFVENPSSGGGQNVPAKYWVWLIIALLAIIVASVIINENM